AYANSLTPDNGVLRLMAHEAVIRTNRPGHDGHEMTQSEYASIVSAVADTLRNVAGLATKSQLVSARELHRKQSLATFLGYVSTPQVDQLELDALRVQSEKALKD